MSSFASTSIDKFIGLNTSRDELSLIPGQLSKNHNYLYMANGGLRERGGGDKLTGSPLGGVVYSLSSYRNENGTEYLITNQATDVYYYSSGWNALSLTLTSNKKMRWVPGGKGTDSALYGINGSDTIVKVSGVTPTGSSVSGSPTDSIAMIKHKKRLFSLNQNGTLYFTEVLDFDTWNTGQNTIDIAPGSGGDGVALEVWGDALFIFKEYGVYVLPNASDPVPKVNWAILRSDAATGTKSPDTVRRTKRGIYYLSSDNFIRNISPNVSFSSGEYSLGGSGSPIISVPIENDMEEILDDAKKVNAQAIVHNDLYIIGFQTVNNALTFNDLTYFADTNKFVQFEGIQEPQPYWGQFTGFDYDFFAIQLGSGKVKLYGAKGDSVAGDVHETLNDTIHNDNSTAIVSKAILGWYPVGGESTYKKMKQIYFVGETENWEIKLKFIAYKFGNLVPSEGEGSSYTYQSSTTNKIVVGTAIVGTAVISDVTVGSKKIRTSLKGHLFRAEFGNENADEFTRIDKMVIYFRPIKNQ